ncbi:beta-Ala-His dipeptidase [Patescibacteria group bacterium]|nr:beta-Ala-His dipeptidase [Patescibacteria group bacterium]
MKRQEILNTFEKIASIPRGSGCEEGIRNWLVKQAHNEKWECIVDSVGNVLIRVPGTKKTDDTIILQGHMDMVCQREIGYEHNFEKDPIKTYIENGWLKAKGTTLGADNGLGIAIALVLAKDKNIDKPNLELLFTVDEETGLTGAIGLRGNLLKGHTLINLDSEEEGIFTIGCAGGVRANINKKYKRQKCRGTLVELEIKGGLGGHSGVDIDKGRANAAKLIARILFSVTENVEFAERINFKLDSIKIGTVTNAIPGHGKAQFLINNGQFESVRKTLHKSWQSIREEYEQTDPQLKLIVKNLGSLETLCLSSKDSIELIEFLIALPNGIFNMSRDVENLVETSTNIGILTLEKTWLEIGYALRGSIQSKLAYLNNQMEKITKFWDGTYENKSPYPGWKPDIKSPILKRAKETYKELFGKAPVVEAVHAGLECGVIGSKYKNMDMISLGPTIKEAHSPNEMAHLESVDKVYTFLVKLLETQL